MAKKHRKHGVPVSRLFAPTMISNSSELAAGYDPFGDGDGGDTVSVAEDAIESGESPAEAVATVMEETGASKSEAVDAVAVAMVASGEADSKAEAKAEIKAEKKKPGRKVGSKNKPKETASVAAAAATPKKKKPKAEAEPKAAPAKVGKLSDVEIDAEVKKKLPNGCYLVTAGKGKCAYCPETGKKYSLKTGEQLKQAGRHSGSGSKPAQRVSEVKPKPASTKPASANAGRKAASPDKAHRIAKAVQELAGLTGLKLAPSFRVDYGDYQQKTAKPKAGTELVSNPKKHMRRNGSDQAKLGPYTLTLLKNPITTFEVAGVKVVPALAGTAGVLTLEKLVEKAMHYVPGWDSMAPGAVKSAAPTLAVMGLAAIGHWYAEKNKMLLLAESCSAVFQFGFVLATSRVIEQHVAKAVDAVTPASTPAASVNVEVKKPMNGGMFADGRQMNGGMFSAERQMNGGSFVGATHQMPAMAGYLARTSGYPNPSIAGSTGYPPVNIQGRMGADSASLARALSPTLSGGAFSSAQQVGGGHDMSEFKDF